MLIRYLLKLFCIQVLHWLAFDLTVAYSTGRNMASIAQLKKERMEWQGILNDLELNT